MRRSYLLGGAALLLLIGLAQFTLANLRYQGKAVPFDKAIEGTVAVELVVDGKGQGIFFLPRGKMVGEFPSALSFRDQSVHQTLITEGMSIHLQQGKVVRIGEMAPHQKLALDIPLDLLTSTPEELMLIPGIGEKTAVKLFAFVRERGCIEDLSELTAIPGIKERRIAQLAPYLKVDWDACERKLSDDR